MIQFFSNYKMQYKNLFSHDYYSLNYFFINNKYIIHSSGLVWCKSNGVLDLLRCLLSPDVQSCKSALANKLLASITASEHGFQQALEIQVLLICAYCFNGHLIHKLRVKIDRVNNSEIWTVCHNFLCQ